MTTLDESIHCIAAPSLQRLFQVLGGGMRNPRQAELVDLDPSGSGPKDSPRKYLWAGIWGHLIEEGE